MAAPGLRCTPAPDAVRATVTSGSGTAASRPRASLCLPVLPPRATVSDLSVHLLAPSPRAGVTADTCRRGLVTDTWFSALNST